jgi:hypothetical protein
MTDLVLNPIQFHVLQYQYSYIALDNFDIHMLMRLYMFSMRMMAEGIF